jgi:hypothetical protein
MIIVYIRGSAALQLALPLALPTHWRGISFGLWFRACRRAKNAWSPMRGAGGVAIAKLDLSTLAPQNAD